MPELLKILTTVSLVAIMISIGQTIDIRNLLPEIKQRLSPWLAGSFGQIILLPLIAYAVIVVFNVPSDIGIGLMLISMCPGGATSNAFSFWAKGDVILSVLLTATSSIAIIFTIPIIITLSANALGITELSAQLDPKRVIGSLFVMTLLPLFAGFALRFFLEKHSEIIGKCLNVLAVFLFASCMLSMWYSTFDSILESAIKAGSYTAAYLGLALLVGFFLGKVLKFTEQTKVTLTLELGLQNVILSYWLSLYLLGDSLYSLPSSFYAVIMIKVAFIIVIFSRKNRSKNAILNH